MKTEKTRIAWKMGRRWFFQISTSQVACSTPSVYSEEMVCLKTFAFTGVERAWWDNKYHRSKKTQCSVSPKSPFSSHQSAQFMTFFWPVKIFPLWKLGPESRGGILTTIEGQQPPLRLAGIIFMFCISPQAHTFWYLAMALIWMI